MFTYVRFPRVEVHSYNSRTTSLRPHKLESGLPLDIVQGMLLSCISGRNTVVSHDAPSALKMMLVDHPSPFVESLQEFFKTHSGLPIPLNKLAAYYFPDREFPPSPPCPLKTARILRALHRVKLELIHANPDVRHNFTLDI